MANAIIISTLCELSSVAPNAVSYRSWTLVAFSAQAAEDDCRSLTDRQNCFCVLGWCLPFLRLSGAIDSCSIHSLSLIGLSAQINRLACLSVSFICRLLLEHEEKILFALTKQKAFYPNIYFFI